MNKITTIHITNDGNSVVPSETITIVTFQLVTPSSEPQPMLTITPHHASTNCHKVYKFCSYNVLSHHPWTLKNSTTNNSHKNHWEVLTGTSMKKVFAEKEDKRNKKENEPKKIHKRNPTILNLKLRENCRTCGLCLSAITKRVFNI